MPVVGAVAAPHSHLQLFTRPAENEKYKSDVQKGRNAMFALREQVERANADTILVIHDDHFVNFDFRCYPPFALLVGQEAKGSGVTDPDTIEQITGATYRKYEGKDAYQSAPSGIPQHMANWDEHKVSTRSTPISACGCSKDCSNGNSTFHSPPMALWTARKC